MSLASLLSKVVLVCVIILAAQVGSTDWKNVKIVKEAAETEENLHVRITFLKSLLKTERDCTERYKKNSNIEVAGGQSILSN